MSREFVCYFFEFAPVTPMTAAEFKKFLKDEIKPLIDKESVFYMFDETVPSVLLVTFTDMKGVLEAKGCRIIEGKFTKQFAKSIKEAREREEGES